MAKPPGKCIFCEKGGLSKEHVFGEWLRKHFPRDADSTHTFGTIDPPTNTTAVKSPDITQLERQGHIGTRKVRVVCRDCNSGWLSALEESVKPILVPLIAGQRYNLTPPSQRTLATWTAKTVMTAEKLRPRENGIPQHERSFIMKCLIPPKNWYVWAAPYHDVLWRNLGIYQGRGRLQTSPVPEPGGITHYIQATTFGVGQILFLVVNTSNEELSNAFTGRDWGSLMQFWPLKDRSIIWPPDPILRDPQANAVANFLTLSGFFDNSFNPLGDWTFTP